VIATPLGDVAWESMGSGPPLVLVHAPALGNDRSEWRRLAPLLAAAGRRVVLLDLPGFGDSEMRAMRYTADAMIAALDVFLDQAVGEPCPLVAADDAAGWCMALARDAARIPALAVIAPTLPRPVDEAAFTAWSERARYETLLDAVGEWLAHEVYCDVALAREETASALARASRPMAEFAGASWLSGSLRRDARLDWLALEQPLLLLWGEACLLPPLDEAERWLMPLRPDLPPMMIRGEAVGVQKQNVRYKSFPATRLRPHVERAEDVARAVAAWLSA
jgi:pimeloyl-ACP methyl ester carboxylesterase